MTTTESTEAQSAGRYVSRPSIPLSMIGAGVVGTGIFALLAAAGRLVMPVVVQQTLDHRSALAGVAQHAVLVVVGPAAALLAATIGCAYVVNRRIAQRTEQFLHDLRSAVFHTLTEEKLGGTVQSARLHDDVEYVSQFARWGGPALLAQVSQLVVAALALLIYSWRLSIVVVLVFVPLVVLVFLRRTKTARENIEGRRLARRVRSRLAEVVISCSEALAYPARRRIADQFSAAASDRDQHDLQTARITYGGLSMLELSIGAAVVVVAGIGVTIGRAGQVSFGQLTAFVLILLMVSAPAQLAVGLLRDGRYAVSGWKRIDRLQRGFSRERQLGS